MPLETDQLGTLDVTVLHGNPPETDRVSRKRVHAIGEPIEFAINPTSHERIEVQLDDYLVISIGFVPPKRDPSAKPAPEQMPTARRVREWV